MNGPSKFLLEGIDHLGKDTLVARIQNRLGYHLVLHYTKPLALDCYATGPSPERMYQESSFCTMFEVLRDLRTSKVILNRTHLGEAVYGPLYRGYSGDYVFDLERRYELQKLTDIRLILLTEDFESAGHFVDDGQSLGGADKRPQEQGLFAAAFERSIITDKKIICVTDRVSGRFRDVEAILEEAIS